MADKSDKKEHGDTTNEEFVTIKIPESLGGLNNVVQFPVSDFSLINDYLLSTGHEYLSTGTEEQQAAIRRWIGLMPNREESEVAEEATAS